MTAVAVMSGALYVLGVLLLTMKRGLWLGIGASVAGAIALCAGDLVAIGVLLTTATIASVIADQARVRAEEASREAAEQERRQVVRDLHDGAQQRLVSTILSLRMAQPLMQADETGASSLVAEALQHAQEATDELRALARGGLPAALTRGGLRNGVDALAARLPMPVELHVPDRRLPADVEAAAYFTVAEGLTNVVKHAAATRAWVVASASQGRLQLEIGDDGIGGADPTGSGLAGIRDRVAAVGGDLGIDSPAGGGTTITAMIPLPAPVPHANRGPAVASEVISRCRVRGRRVAALRP